MLNTYKEYLQKPKSISIEVMEKIHNELLLSINGDSEALELYDEFIKIATKYAQMRADWTLMTPEEKIDKDSLRTSYHNSVIIHLNMIARYVKMKGKNNSWRDMLGYEEDDKYNRKTIGDFACYVVFINCINMR